MGEQYQLALCNVSVQTAHIHWIHISNSNTAVLNKKLNVFALKNITDTKLNAKFKLIKSLHCQLSKTVVKIFDLRATGYKIFHEEKKWYGVIKI